MTSTPRPPKQKVEKYFGDIPAGPPVARQQSWVAKRTGSPARDHAGPGSPGPDLQGVEYPGLEHAPTRDYLNLVSDVLSSGKTSRLYKRLVYDDQIATDVSAYLDLREIGGLFVIRGHARVPAPISPGSRRRWTRSWPAFWQAGPPRPSCAG